MCLGIAYPIVHSVGVDNKALTLKRYKQAFLHSPNSARVISTREKYDVASLNCKQQKAKDAIFNFVSGGSVS